MPSLKNLADDPSRYALRSARLGAIVWIIMLAWQSPSPQDSTWAVATLLLAPLVLVPLALRLVEPDGTWIILRAAWRLAILWQLPAAFLLEIAFLLEQSWIAAALALPWLITTLLIAFTGVLRVSLEGWRSWEETAISAGLVYIAVGGGWVLLDRLGAQPLSFEPIIVLLTAIHFHYAGFLLPLFTGLAGRKIKSGVATLAAIGAVLGVPLVAIGITTTQLGFNPILEASAAWLASFAGLLTAALHLRMAMQQHSLTVKILFVLCGLALAFGMILSGLYAARFYAPLAWLDIPMMRALHGSANALGFGLAGAPAWSGLRQK